MAPPPPAPTIASALAQALAAGLSRLDAQLLVAHTVAQSRVWLVTHDQDVLSATQSAQFQEWLQRRTQGEPLAYLLGEQEFHGLTLQVSPDVLVPRPETEGLVDWALELLHAHTATWPEPRVIDLGTGSGAIALALKHRAPAAQVCALDISPDALAIARRNGERLGLAIQWQRSAWWTDMQGQHFHLAVSNPPYIAGNDPHLAALGHEPRGALTPEGDGLCALREIIAHAPQHLHPGGWLLMEHGYDQAEAVRQLLAQQGFTHVRTRPDLAGIDRCTGGQWPA
jgi:release factor glutamine methyltransferase